MRWLLSESLDLGAKIVLVVEPRAGNLRFPCHCVERDWCTGVFHAAQRGDGALAGGGRAAAGCGDYQVGVVRP
jgi:hypothetical protein